MVKIGYKINTMLEEASMARPKTTRYKGITRIDHPPKKTYGYNVRVRWKGTTYGKFFSDRKFGDRLAALAAAIEWRDKTEREIGKPRTEHPVVSVNSRNKTGIIGIRRRREGNHESFEANWVLNGKVGRTRFSITRHGEKGALKLAMRARMQHERMRWRSPKTHDTNSPAMSAKTPEQPPVQSPPQAPTPPSGPEDSRWEELLRAARSRLDDGYAYP
jgi:hypothetical protein